MVVVCHFLPTRRGSTHLSIRQHIGRSGGSSILYSFRHAHLFFSVEQVREPLCFYADLWVRLFLANMKTAEEATIKITNGAIAGDFWDGWC